MLSPVDFLCLIVYMHQGRIRIMIAMPAGLSDGNTSDSLTQALVRTHLIPARVHRLANMEC
eukprot:scaffold33571_cov196-Skeletonema_dohrnii-CCMP3373.AAC.1